MIFGAIFPKSSKLRVKKSENKIDYVFRQYTARGVRKMHLEHCISSFRPDKLQITYYMLPSDEYEHCSDQFRNIFTCFVCFVHFAGPTETLLDEFGNIVKLFDGSQKCLSFSKSETWGKMPAFLYLLVLCRHIHSKKLCFSTRHATNDYLLPSDDYEREIHNLAIFLAVLCVLCVSVWCQSNKKRRTPF